ncbi:MAG: hypothetical protein JWN43_4042 [Gammaproteobacteria bacterium]|nr:hypothetical protein [Gammaproteobacteria bacterium]
MNDRAFNPVHIAMTLALSLVVGSAHAALGGDAASIVADAGDLHGRVTPLLLQQYDVHEITADNGLRVREFLNRNGVVFAVAWSGPVQPDLQRLLGASFEEYTHLLSTLTQPGLRRSLRVASSDLVVESGGHMRAYNGRAYLPALIPAGISAVDLR